MSTEMVALTEFAFCENPIRVVGTKHDPWFVGVDVATALGYKNPQEAVRKHVPEEDKGVSELLTPGGTQKLVVIDEAGLYYLIFRSKLESAQKFTWWVTHEVLPSIRKYGYYKAPKPVKQRRPTRGRPMLLESGGITKAGLNLRAASLGMRLVDAKKMKRPELEMFCDERSDPDWIEANYDNYPYSYAELDAEVGGCLNLILLYVKGLEKYAMNERGTKGQESFRFTQEFKDNLPVFAKKARVEISCRA